MDWRKIPSLHALRAFEATARLQSQSAAADELNVTHAAINQHIRTLESVLDVKLFAREGRRIVLTPKGEQLFRHVSHGFQEISKGVEALQDPNAESRLRVSFTKSQYERWLLPRIQRFWKAHPEVHLEVDASARLTDLDRDNFDLAVRYGRGHWPPFEAEYFMHGRYGIFASKAYLDAHPDAKTNVASANWIRSEDSPEFFELHQKLALDFSQDPHHLVLSSNGEARSAMIAGLGLLAQDRQFLLNELQFGLIEEVQPVELPEDIGYYFVTKPGAKSSHLKTFMAWLRAEAKTNA